MAKRYHKPDYEVLYPGVEISAEVLGVLKKSYRKMEYMESDLKAERTVKDEDGVVVGFLPSREDSFERLLEVNLQFVSDAPAPEDVIETQEEVDELYRCLDLLDKDERALIVALFFNGLTEREYAAQIGRKQQSINERKLRILDKLKKLFN